MRPNRDNQTQLMTKAITGGRNRPKKKKEVSVKISSVVLAPFGPFKSYRGSVGDSQSLKADAHVGVLSGSGENNDGYSRVDELSGPDELQ